MVKSFFALLILFFVFLATAYVRAETTEYNLSNEEKVSIPDISDLAGGYRPKNDIVLGDFKFALFEIRLSEDKENAQDVVFLIRKTNDIEFMRFYHCSYFDISHGKISAKVEDTPIGSIFLEGKFLPAKQGDYWLVSSSTPVLKAQINITVKDEVVFSSKDQEFVFVIGK